MCALCGKPVDRLEWSEDFHTFERVIRVFCHGETEVMRFNPERMPLDGLRQMAESVGVAFDTKALQPPKEPTT